MCKLHTRSFLSPHLHYYAPQVNTRGTFWIFSFAPLLTRNGKIFQRGWIKLFARRFDCNTFVVNFFQKQGRNYFENYEWSYLYSGTTKFKEVCLQKDLKKRRKVRFFPKTLVFAKIVVFFAESVHFWRKDSFFCRNLIFLLETRFTLHLQLDWSPRALQKNAKWKVANRHTKTFSFVKGERKGSDEWYHRLCAGQGWAQVRNQVFITASWQL